MRTWFGRLQQFGMTRYESHHYVFIEHSSSNKYAYLVVYVDDILITSDDSEGIKALKQQLFPIFQTKDLDPICYFFRMCGLGLSHPYKIDL